MDRETGGTLGYRRDLRQQPSGGYVTRQKGESYIIWATTLIITHVNVTNVTCYVSNCSGKSMNASFT